VKRRTFICDLREAAGVIPALGIVGADAIREAFEGDLRQLQDLLQGAIKTALELTGEEDWWPYVHGLFDDYIVIEGKDGRLLSYPYTVDGTKVALQAPSEVSKTFVPVAGSAPAIQSISEAVDGAGFLETAGSGKYRIRIIRGGVSGNGNYYPDSVLREAVSLFDGVRVFNKSDKEHLAGEGKAFENLIGALKNPVFVEGIGGAPGEIHGDLILLEPEGTIATKLREAWNQSLTELFGFSIDVRAVARMAKIGGQAVREAVKFVIVNSVDLIIEPGAGGGILHMLEAQADQDSGEHLMDRVQIIALLEAKGLLNGKKTDDMTDDQLVAMLTEAVPEPAPATTIINPAQTAPLTAADLKLFEARQYAMTTVAASTLPDKAKARLASRFRSEQSFTEAVVDQAITDEREYLASLTESGAIRGLGNGSPIIQAGETPFERIDDMFEAFFDRGHPDHRQAQSFKECYLVATGDKHFTGRAERNSPIFREALDSSSFPEVLGNSITRRLIADYRVQVSYDAWRQVADTTNLSDFREQNRTRYGGYGDLPPVAEKGSYDPLASPTDEAARYSPTKRGGTESISLEMIRNDDVSVIRRIPINMSRAAKRTLGKFVFDFFRSNPVVYDGVALFHATHGNLGAAALNSASLAAGRLAMLKQTEKDSGDRLNIPAKSLLIPSDLEETAVDLFRRSTENDKTFVQSLALDIIPVWYWSDPDDWCLVADPNEAPIIEIGFMDGQEEPSIYVQDMPNVGSMFVNDTITYKIRHIYGGAPLDFRGAYKSIPV
jgi:hypothetical protein